MRCSKPSSADDDATIDDDVDDGVACETARGVEDRSDGSSDSPPQDLPPPPPPPPAPRDGAKNAYECRPDDAADNNIAQARRGVFRDFMINRLSPAPRYG